MFSSYAYADSTVSIRLQDLPSQSNRSDLTITFTALDTNNNPISVYCFKKGPSDGGFSQFAGPITLSNGGNTSTCNAGGSVITQDGTYQFYATATDGVNTATSGTATVTINRDSPGTPLNYNKQKIDDCTYKISFRTANDGRTVRVELYSSQNSSFTVDSGSKVNSLNIGPDTDGSITNGIGDCSKTYYFAIRAFDAYGNGSGVVGDSSTITTVINPTTTPAVGAIPVSGNAGANGGTGGQGVLGAETTPTPAALSGTPAEKQVLGNETTPEPTKTQKGTIVSNTGLWAGAAVLLIAVFGLVWYFLTHKRRS